MRFVSVALLLVSVAIAVGCSSDDSSPTSDEQATAAAPESETGDVQIASGDAPPGEQACDEIEFTESYPDSAINVRAHGVDCSGAEQLIQAAHDPCKAPGEPCPVAGFICRLSSEPGGQLVPLRCTDGDRRVAWTFSGGY